MQVDFVKGLRDVEEITDYLLCHEILSRTQAEKILSSGPIVADQVRSLLNVLVRCGPDAYDNFVSALSETNQSSFVEKMANLSISSRPASPLSPPSKMESHVPEHPTQTISAYPVNSTPLGYILLVNISNFEEGSGLSARLGSSEDVVALKALFTDLGYSVEVLLDPTAAVLESSLSAFIKSPCHYEVDAGGLIVMSHGVQDYIYTADGKLFAINDILEAFTNKSFPALAGKPKFILFQACRGEEKDRGYIFEPDDASFVAPPLESVDARAHKTLWKCLPYMSDYIIAYSTLPGFVSWRSEKAGSWFIQILIDVFRKYASSLHVLDLLTEVNRRLVEESQEREFKQITQQSHTLTRPFYLAGTHSQPR
ncbi:Caspase-2 [Taenia crassiceps]|uniref:Caspase-2 n=1 Tax=Taenia crassiceps TaxID=6207 RepID=A0ABR4QG53_9CEST